MSATAPVTTTHAMQSTPGSGEGTATAPGSRERRDWRPGQRAKALTLAVGGFVYAVSHALHLVPGHSGSTSLPHEIAAQVTFGLGAVLIMAGLGSLMSKFRHSPTGVLGVQLSWFGMLFIQLSAYTQLFILPVVGWDGLHEIDALAWPVGLAAPLGVFVGPVLLAIAGLRHRVVPVAAAIGILVSVAGLIVMMLVPELEAPMAIGTSILLGLSYAWAGLAARR